MAHKYLSFRQSVSRAKPHWWAKESLAFLQLRGVTEARGQETKTRRALDYYSKLCFSY